MNADALAGTRATAPAHCSVALCAKMAENTTPGSNKRKAEEDAGALVVKRQRTDAGALITLPTDEKPQEARTSDLQAPIMLLTGHEARPASSPSLSPSALPPAPALPPPSLPSSPSSSSFSFRPRSTRSPSAQTESLWPRRARTRPSVRFLSKPPPLLSLCSLSSSSSSAPSLRLPPTRSCLVDIPFHSPPLPI